jgi:hypothetical protein
MNDYKKTPSFTLFQIKSYWGILVQVYTKRGEMSSEKM